MRRSSPVLPTTSRSPGSCTRSSPRRNLAAPTPPASATSMAFPRSGPGAALRIAPPAAGSGNAWPVLAGRGVRASAGAVVGRTSRSAGRCRSRLRRPLPGSRAVWSRRCRCWRSARSSAGRWSAGSSAAGWSSAGWSPAGRCLRAWSARRRVARRRRVGRAVGRGRGRGPVGGRCPGWRREHVLGCWTAAWTRRGCCRSAAWRPGWRPRPRTCTVTWPPAARTLHQLAVQPGDLGPGRPLVLGVVHGVLGGDDRLRERLQGAGRPG